MPDLTIHRSLPGPTRAEELRQAAAVDATADIQKAADDLPAAGGTLRFLPGRYNLSAAITLLRSNIRIHLSAGAILKASSGFSGDAMFVFGDGTTAYRNVGITGPGGFSGALLDCNSNAARAVRFAGPLAQCYVTGFEATGGTGTGCINFQGVVSGTELRHALARDLYLHDTLEGILAIDVNDVLFDGCTVIDMTDQDCLEFSRVDRGRMLGCYCEQPSTANACIDIFDACRDILVAGCHLRATSDDSLRGIDVGTNTPRYVLLYDNIIEGVFAFGIRSVGADDLSIVGNRIRDISGTIVDGKGIDVRGDRLLIALNTISDCAHNLIVFGGEDVKILDNVLKNSTLTFLGTGADINMTSTSRRVQIRGNHFLNDQGVPKNDFHVLNPIGVDLIAEGNFSDGNRRTRPFANQNTADLIVRHNDATFFVSEASGTATVASGTTTVVVSHGLDYTPSISLIHITPNENPTNPVNNFWISTVTSTQFTINVNTDPGASGLDFAWVINPKV